MKTLTRVETFIIEDCALLEIRHFERAYLENFIFIHDKYIQMYFPDNRRQINKKEKPESKGINNPSDYTLLTELKTILKDEDYNLILIDLLFKAIAFYQVNVIIPFISEVENFTKDQTNQIISYALKSAALRKSFEAQRRMLGFVNKNKRKIDSTLFDRILREFPHSNSS